MDPEAIKQHARNGNVFTQTLTVVACVSFDAHKRVRIIYVNHVWRPHEFRYEPHGVKMKHYGTGPTAVMQRSFDGIA